MNSVHFARHVAPTRVTWSAINRSKPIPPFIYPLVLPPYTLPFLSTMPLLRKAVSVTDEAVYVDTIKPLSGCQVTADRGFALQQRMGDAKPRVHSKELWAFNKKTGDDKGHESDDDFEPPSECCSVSQYQREVARRMQQRYKEGRRVKKTSNRLLNREPCRFDGKEAMK